MQSVVIVIHVLACLFLICLVLLQSGKEGMGVIFGGGSSSLFGSSGAGGLLTKMTAWVAAVFLLTSLTYNYLTSAKRQMDGGSIMRDVQIEEPAAPVAPAPVPGAQPAPAPAAPGEQPKQ